MTRTSNPTPPTFHEDGYTLPAISRRGFLTRSAAAAATVGSISLISGRLAFATPNDPAAGDAVITIFLRGGMDGLSLVPPYGYDSYRRLRPSIAIGPPGSNGGALPLAPGGPVRFSPGFENNVVGLHPGLKPIHDTLWQEGTLAVIPGVGTDEDTTRSHFSAQSIWERGAAPLRVQTGFVDRLITLQGPGTALAGMSKSKSLSASLRGPSGSVTVDDLRRFGIQGFRRRANAMAAIDGLYEGTGLVETTGQRVVGVIDQLSAYAEAASQLGAYPDTSFGRDLHDIAVLLGTNVGLRAATVDLGGWDTHSNQGNGAGGRFTSRVQELGNALRAFTDDLKSSGAYGETVILVITEFGRTINENGSGGTDHGRATSILLMGGGIQGGVFGYDYYDQIADDPNYGDLTVLTDWRDPVSQVMRARTGINPVGLFPTLNPQADLGLVRT